MIKDIPDLVKAGIISPETGENILLYYKQRQGQPNNRLLVVFGILGALLTGLGIILIIAHNWDELSRPVKTTLAFLPLLLAQFFCGYTLLRRKNSTAWTESTSVFLFFAVGASMSLVSQIYNIPGDINSFILTWMVLCLPVIYLLDSAAVSLLFIIGITSYGVNSGYWTYPAVETNYYWALMLMVLPEYYLLYKRNPNSNFTVFHDWLIPLSVTIMLGTVGRSNEELMFVAYVSLFGLFYLIGNTKLFKREGNSSYTLLGSLGTVCILLALTFDFYWDKLRNGQPVDISSPEFIVSLLITIIASVMLFRQKRKTSFSYFQPIEPVFLIFIIAFIIGHYSEAAVILTNIMVFVIGLMTIRKGVRLDHLGILNYGLMIIMALVICRFFDSDLSFVARGIMFISVGAGFLVLNMHMIKKRKNYV